MSDRIDLNAVGAKVKAAYECQLPGCHGTGKVPEGGKG